MKWNLFLILFACLSFVTNNLKSQNCKIEGTIKNEKGEVLEYVSIGVYQNDNLLTGSISDGNGSFSVKANCNEKYQLKIRYIGYEELSKEIVPKDLSSALSFQLNPSKTTLATVSISADKPIVERKVDRLIYYVDINRLGANSTGLEALKTAPSVWMDANGGLRINGKTGARVMVNGKLLNLNGQQLQSYLSGIDAKQILNIEVISIPGAEYDAASKGGIINIIMKKRFLDGFNANTYIGYERGRYDKYSGGIFSNYKKGKLTTTANFYTYDDRNFTDLTEERENPNTSFSLNSSSFTTLLLIRLKIYMETFFMTLMGKLTFL